MGFDAVRDGKSLLDEIFRPNAAIEIAFSRDEKDDFCIDAQLLPNADALPIDGGLMSLIPSGSRWDAARGWRAFFGRAISLSTGDYFMVGMEGVVGHPSRGAYPVMKAFGFTPAKPPIDQLVLLEQRLHRTEDTCEVGEYGVLRTGSRSPEEHVGVEAKVIRRAIEAYRSGNRFVFRTLIICESQVPRGPRGSLMATVPSITSAFRKRVKVKLAFCRQISP